VSAVRAARGEEPAAARRLIGGDGGLAEGRGKRMYVIAALFFALVRGKPLESVVSVWLLARLLDLLGIDNQRSELLARIEVMQLLTMPNKFYTALVHV
jgi:hypothetical protein